MNEIAKRTVQADRAILLAVLLLAKRKILLAAALTMPLIYGLTFNFALKGISVPPPLPRLLNVVVMQDWG